MRPLFRASPLVWWDASVDGCFHGRAARCSLLCAAFWTTGARDNSRLAAQRLPVFRTPSYPTLGARGSAGKQARHSRTQLCNVQLKRQRLLCSQLTLLLKTFRCPRLPTRSRRKPCIAAYLADGPSLSSCGATPCACAVPALHRLLHVPSRRPLQHPHGSGGGCCSGDGVGRPMAVQSRSLALPLALGRVATLFQNGLLGTSEGGPATLLCRRWIQVPNHLRSRSCTEFFGPLSRTSPPPCSARLHGGHQRRGRWGRRLAAPLGLLLADRPAEDKTRNRFTSSVCAIVSSTTSTTPTLQPLDSLLGCLSKTSCCRHTTYNPPRVGLLSQPVGLPSLCV